MKFISFLSSRLVPPFAHDDASDTQDDTLLSPPSTDDSDALSKPTGSPLISQLYSEAAEFEKVLVHSGCIDSRSIHRDGENGFDDLVARDLSVAERAIVDRAAKISATGNDWIPRDQDVEKNVLYSEEDKSVEEGVTPVSALKKKPVRRPSQEEEISLGPDQIVDILVEEFGPLATDGDKETLILEADGCLIHDVAIMGVIHVTTHRMAFHASLLATRPDLSPSQDVIKSGPATLHRKGWHAKRRVWVELTHDMVCTYASSTDEGRTRPLSTTLLSFIKEILAWDPKQPRYLRVGLDPSIDDDRDYVEFDTEESAQDWRRELTGALFLYRYHRRVSCAGSVPDSEAGVRISCPLDRVAEHRTWPDFPWLMNLRVDISHSDVHPYNMAGEDEDDSPRCQVFQIGPVKPIPTWTRFGEYVTEAKRRSELHPPLLQAPVFVDFGPFSFFERVSPTADSDEASAKEMAIRTALGFGAESKLWIARARIYRTITTSGYFVISAHHVGFWSKGLTQSNIRYRLPISSITYAEPFHLNWVNVDALSLGIEGQPDMKFVFKTVALRDEAMDRINANRAAAELVGSSDVRSGATTPSTASGTTTPSLLLEDTPAAQNPTRLLAPLSRTLAAAVAAAGDLPADLHRKIPKVINLPQQLLIAHAPLHFVCLTIGSRGDVQPYIALGLGLKKEGHKVTIVTHEEYREWILGFGIEHRTAGGDPGALMKLSVENKMFSPEFFKESLSNFRPWLDQLLLDAWTACKDADVLLESPSAMAGVHIAEALNIPYFRTFTMPWSKTTEFPHAFLSPPVESPTFNSASYVLFSNVMWAATSRQINKWRRQTLKIGNTDMGHLAQSKITFIYNFSQAVVPKPLDWPDTTIISGYWFLDNPDLDWTPPQDLLDWMDKARKDEKPIVYIGFGSITVPHPNRVTARIVEAVVRSDVRAIISKGWSARMSKFNEKEPEVEIPPQCYMVDKIPHDWLFPKIDAALHHGGAGTTGASLRAGIPTLIKPWFGDQFFWASRVQRLGAGLKVPSLRVNDLSEALTKATTSRTIKKKAAHVGEKIRTEDGVHTAIYAIYTYLHRASQDRALLTN